MRMEKVHTAPASGDEVVAELIANGEAVVDGLGVGEEADGDEEEEESVDAGEEHGCGC